MPFRRQTTFIPRHQLRPPGCTGILRNRFISNLRKRRETTDIDDVPQSVFATDASHEDRLALKELGAAMNRLPADQREALVMVVDPRHELRGACAKSTGCAVGTAKSRVFRARRQLESWLMGEPKETSTLPVSGLSRQVCCSAIAQDAPGGNAQSPKHLLSS